MATVDLDRLYALQAQRYLSVQEHPEAALLIWNYTPRAQFDRVWTPETLLCRGLITDTEGTIVARPFPKFFNVTEHLAAGGVLPDEPFEITEKLDGSLGILYWAQDQPAIATRGAFLSEQARTGTQLLRERYGDFPFDRQYTYLFEVIYPANRVIVDYGDRKDLVLLAVIETETGADQPVHHRDWPFPVAARYDSIRDLAELRARLDQAGDEAENREGFVVRFVPSNLRLKVKFAEYTRLSRLLTRVSARTIWDKLATGQSLDPLLDRVPDEFYTWVRTTVEGLQAQYTAIEQECARDAASAQKLPTRKAQAALVRYVRYPEIVFKMLDGKPCSPAIWKLLRPETSRPFRPDDEA